MQQQQQKTDADDGPVNARDKMLGYSVCARRITAVVQVCVCVCVCVRVCVCACVCVCV